MKKGGGCFSSRLCFARDGLRVAHFRFWAEKIVYIGHGET